MKIAFQKLVSQLREAKEQDPKELWEMPDYVFDHIFRPLLNDEKVLFENLDFTRFDYDDLAVLADSIQSAWQETQKIRKIRDIFLEAPPVCAKARAFC